ncbi:uncharacterized protein RCO7_14608 [Rhynchosporium graminicola]|uniref:Uncharacterized protein n=1 Tax=Rhynchosporium graminicola TaxID=2792576 RepID=A0A1E1KRB8_9HELO|nr:uncharacterized protein RCO7_14608 [Rhynchosporium commune]
MATPSRQAFVDIEEILKFVKITLASTKNELDSMKSKNTINEPGFVGRGARLLIIHTEAKTAGLEHFLRRLMEVNLPRKPGRTEISSEEKLSRSENHKVAYRFDLSFGYMQLGAATKDLVEILNRQIGKLKSEKKIRFKRADAARVNVESAYGKRSKSGEIFIEHG